MKTTGDWQTYFDTYSLAFTQEEGGVRMKSSTWRVLQCLEYPDFVDDDDDGREEDGE
jgi:hypothetical protein